MNRQPNIRLNVPAQARRGEVVVIRAMIIHPMETGRRTTTQGVLIPVSIIETVTGQFNGQEVFRADLNTAIAANPFLSFPLRVEESGEVALTYREDSGTEWTYKARIEVTD